MSTKSFTDVLETTRTEAMEYIRGVLKSRGTGYELTDPANYEEDIEDSVYSLPRGFNVSKRGYYDEYPIVIINIDKNEKLSFEGLSCLGDTDEDYYFEEDDLSIDTVCAIADLVQELEN